MIRLALVAGFALLLLQAVTSIAAHAGWVTS